MTYDAQELSVEGGQPVELYTITVGAETFNFTSAEDMVNVEGVDYDPVEIARTDVGEGFDERNQVTEITLPSNNEFARKYVNLVPGTVANVTIRRYHRTDGAEEVVLLYKGRVRSVSFDLQGTRAKVGVLPLLNGAERSGPRYVYSSQCNHNLYDSRCKVNQNLFRHIGTVSAINGSLYTVDGLDAALGVGESTAGFMQVGGVDFRLILAHTAVDTVRLILPFDDEVVAIGTTVDVFAGCAHDIATCNSKFSNVPNFGGFAFVPLRNIFSSGIQ